MCYYKDVDFLDYLLRSGTAPLVTGTKEIPPNTGFQKVIKNKIKKAKKRLMDFLVKQGKQV